MTKSSYISTFLLLCLVLLQLVSPVHAIRPPGATFVVRLTDASFYPRTQANQGMTAGDWMVLFVPTVMTDDAIVSLRSFEKFADLCKADHYHTYPVSPAIVECGLAPKVCETYGVTDTTKLVLLTKKKRMYSSTEAFREVQDVVHFYRDIPSLLWAPIPTPPSFFSSKSVALTSVTAVVAIIGLVFYCASNPRKHKSKKY